ncbi:hypothetical protein CBS101457_006216 [Exobasidium rhododendri]|nr:hypothetical protein CBS101457_006216 [Exobasidium rhododendri]
MSQPRDIVREERETMDEGSTFSRHEGSMTGSEEDEQLDQIPLSTPSISMSAGADPWADPSPAAAAAVVEGAVPPSKRRGDNPWASNIPDVAYLAEGKTNAPVASEDTKGATAAVSKEAAPVQDDERWGEYHLPKLGNAVARYWSFKPGFLQLNNGSYGACPKIVCDAYKSLQDRQEENPDLFRRLHMRDMLEDSRSKVAQVLNCPVGNIVLIANATTGTNAVLRDLVYRSDDAILYLSLTYGAVGKNIDYLVETEKMRGVRLHRVVVQVTMPMSKQDILDNVKKAIDDAHSQGKNIRIGIVDTVASRPGIKLPWVEMVKILKDRQILSLVDGAHGIGHIPIDLTAADPDFFVSNCHKWLYAHRGCAVFYVASRNLHLQRTSLPTSWSYQNEASSKSNTWVQQWGDAGTLDVSPFLSVNAALEFRQKMGGEDRIMKYNHDLAIRGGKAAASILDTCIMDLPDESLTACMVNVQLPIIRSRIGTDLTVWINYADSWFFTSLYQEFRTALPVFEYDGKLWARFSAQIWLEVADFEYGARALLELCTRINEGTAPDFRSGAAPSAAHENTIGSNDAPIDG